MTNYSKDLILNVTSIEKELLIKALKDLIAALVASTDIKHGNLEVSAETVSGPVYPRGWKSKYTGWKTLKLEVEYKEN